MAPDLERNAGGAARAGQQAHPSACGGNRNVAGIHSLEPLGESDARIAARLPGGDGATAGPSADAHLTAGSSPRQQGTPKSERHDPSAGDR